EALASVLQANQAAGHQTMWVAHSQGGELFSEAMNIAAANGASDLSMNTVRFNAGANNWLVTNSNADNLGITVTGYYGSPLDIVPNFVGLNGNIFSIPISLIMAPTLFMSDLSPHTEPRDDWYMLQPGTGAMGPFPSPMGPFPPR
ncbi:MAG: hypothetical protein KAX37_09945, partial [Opitutaceae bacterium]|nr:hypothetical protein [Opitutaceae bacterium]